MGDEARAGEEGADDCYVWWGKIRSPNRQQPLPHIPEILTLQTQIERGEETHLYLTDYRSLYVAHLDEITADDVLGDTPDEIEHILPQNPSLQAELEFGTRTDPAVAQRLGNLVLVEKSINASLGNKPFSQKRPVYQQSQLLLTRAIAERPKVGVNTLIDQAVANLEPFAEWNEDTVNRRQISLAALARVVWNLPPPVSKPLTRQAHH